jgi:hypothetical protein
MQGNQQRMSTREASGSMPTTQEGQQHAIEAPPGFVGICSQFHGALLGFAHTSMEPLWIY